MIEPMPEQLILSLPTETATQRLGQAIAAHMDAGFKLYLQGDLGAGKSTLTRAILRALGVRGTLRSPSYALLEPYEGVLPSGGTLHHFDFYRLDAQPLAWRDAGFADAFEPPHAAVVEWPQYAQGLPSATLAIQLSINADSAARTAVCLIDAAQAELIQALRSLNA